MHYDFPQFVQGTFKHRVKHYAICTVLLAWWYRQHVQCSRTLCILMMFVLLLLFHISSSSSSSIGSICTVAPRFDGVQKKAALRNASQPQITPRSLSENSTDTQVPLPPPRPCPMMPIHTNQPWFHGHISRERSVSLLAEHGLVDGYVLDIWTTV